VRLRPSAVIVDDHTVLRDAAVARLYNDHWVALVRLAGLMVDDRETAEDVVQEAFTELWRRWDRLRAPDKGLGYLRTAVLNRSRSILRRRRVARLYSPHLEPAAASAEHAVVVHEDHDEVQVAMATLPVRMREVLVLRFYLDLPHAEIARTLGISESSARATASRGLAALDQKLRGLR
jgi:RNA polymerase sigma-70 factor (sigma-E family)